MSLHPDDIRDEKVKVLRCIAPAGLADCVLGQYVADKVGSRGGNKVLVTRERGGSSSYSTGRSSSTHCN